MLEKISELIYPISGKHTKIYWWLQIWKLTASNFSHQSKRKKVSNAAQTKSSISKENDYLMKFERCVHHYQIKTTSLEQQGKSAYYAHFYFYFIFPPL